MQGDFYALTDFLIADEILIWEFLLKQ